MKIPNNAIRKAAFTRLNADLSMAVYEAVKQGTDYPYITIGNLSGANDGSKTGDSSEIYLDINVWSDYFGAKEVDDTLSLINVSMTASNIDTTGDGFKVYLTRVSTWADERLLDKENVEIRQGIITFRLLVQET